MSELTENSGRYNRQEIYSNFGPEAQRRLASARITIVGCGGLGSSLAEQMVRSGAGRVRLIDADRVDISNIHRQHLFGQGDVGQLKVEAARQRLRTINDNVEIETAPVMLDDENACDLVSGSDIVLDGLDNFQARAALNRACAALAIPWVFCGVGGSELMTMCIIPQRTGCLSCALDMPESGKSHPGILPPVVWAASGLQAMEVFKFFAAGDSRLMNCRLLSMDLWALKLRHIDPLPRDENCPVCGIIANGG